MPSVLLSDVGMSAVSGEDSDKTICQSVPASASVLAAAAAVPAPIATASASTMQGANGVVGSSGPCKEEGSGSGSGSRSGLGTSPPDEGALTLTELEKKAARAVRLSSVLGLRVRSPEVGVDVNVVRYRLERALLLALWKTNGGRLLYDSFAFQWTYRPRSGPDPDPDPSVSPGSTSTRHRSSNSSGSDCRPGWRPGDRDMGTGAAADMEIAVSEEGDRDRQRQGQGQGQEVGLGRGLGQSLLWRAGRDQDQDHGIVVSHPLFFDYS